MNHGRDDETNLERRQELLHDEEAFRLDQEEKRLRSARRSNTLNWIINNIFGLAGIVQILELLQINYML